MLPGQYIDAHAHWFKELLPQNLSGMTWKYGVDWLAHMTTSMWLNQGQS